VIEIHADGTPNGKACLYDKSTNRFFFLDFPRGKLITNNVSEYFALIFSLNYIIKNKYRNVNIRLDSELVVKQVNGEYRVKDPKMAYLLGKVKQLMQQIEGIKVSWIPREKNIAGKRLEAI